MGLTRMAGESTRLEVRIGMKGMGMESMSMANTEEILVLVGLCEVDLASDDEDVDPC